MNILLVNQKLFYAEKKKKDFSNKIIIILKYFR